MTGYVDESNSIIWVSDSGLKLKIGSVIPENSPSFQDTAFQAIKRAMVIIAEENILTKRLKQWKKDQGIVSLTFDELLKKVKGKKLIVQQKVDGQSALMKFKNGKARFGSLGGRITGNIPVLGDIEKILKNQDVKNADMVGELAAMRDGKILPFNETESIIKNPQADKNLITWHPYQILELNGEKIGDDFESYSKIWPNIEKLFKGADHVHSVESYDGDESDLKKAWNKLVIKGKNEGVVVRTSDGKVYKSKPEFTYDLVILAVGDKKGRNWPKRKIGTTLMAFMDKDHIFRVAGEIGTGWTDEEARELYSWAQKNKVGEDDRYVWVKPQRIMEVQWERSTISDRPAYKYEHGEYEKVEKRPAGGIEKPRFVRYRKDKSVNTHDLRLTQIPDWKETKKSSIENVLNFFKMMVPEHPVKKQTHKCPRCGGFNATYREEHPDTDMNEIVLSCPDCGYSE